MKCCVSIDVGTWTNWLTFVTPNIVRTPQPDCFLRYRLNAATRNFTSGKSDVYILAAAATRGFKMVLRPTAAMRRGFKSKHLCRRYVRFRHPDYDPDRAQKLISSSISPHLSTRNIHLNPCTCSWRVLLTLQTDKQTRAKTCTSSFVGGKDTKMRRVTAVYTFRCLR